MVPHGVAPHAHPPTSLQFGSGLQPHFGGPLHYRTDYSGATENPNRPMAGSGSYAASLCTTLSDRPEPRPEPSRPSSVMPRCDVATRAHTGPNAPTRNDIVSLDRKSLEGPFACCASRRTTASSRMLTQQISQAGEMLYLPEEAFSCERSFLPRPGTGGPAGGPHCLDQHPCAADGAGCARDTRGGPNCGAPFHTTT